MGLLFGDELLDEFGSWPLAYIPYGGADFGEVQAVGAAVGHGGADAYHDAFVAAGDRLAASAEAAGLAGHRTSARGRFLRASAFYSAAYHPLYGKPVDPRLLAAYAKQVDALEKGFALFDVPIARCSIPFEGISMPAYLVPAVGHERETRPTIIFTNGYDGTITDMFFASAVAASRRGYHSLLFDGPGQGGLLYREGVTLRHDWETVVNAVVDFALGLAEVDPDRLALSGWSLGGYLAPRGASGEPRLAACIADPGQWAILDAMAPLMAKLGLDPASIVDPASADQTVLDRMSAVIASIPKLHWGVVQRGYWVNGVDDLRSFLAKAARFTMAGRAEAIRCPTLVTAAENDPLAVGAGKLFDALRCPKRLVRFEAAAGVGGHCEMGNRSLLNDTALDWLDEVLKRP